MTENSEPQIPQGLQAIKSDVLRFGRYLLTFLGLPAFILNSAPAWMSGGVSLYLWVQTVVFPGAVVLAWVVKDRSQKLQALVLAVPVAVVSVASLGQWGLTFGAGILQMAVLSVLLVFFYTSRKTLLVFILLVLFTDLAMGLAITQGWIPGPDPVYSDPGRIENWQRVFVTTAAAIPVTLFILARALESMVQALRESEDRLVRLKEEQAEKEEAQKALNRAQRMEVVGRLASGLSHDFNNTLTLIRGSAELLQMNPTEEEVAELTEAIIRAADNAADLSRRLLIFSRQGQATDPEPVDLGASLQRLGKSLRRLLPSDMEVNIRARATRPAKADPSQLDQAILNLCLNARDAMPEGGWLELFAEDREMADGSPGVVLQVRDSGVGMDPETLARATEPFFTTKSEGKGTGLGLAMVKKMVDQHGGELHIDSRPGLGSSFTLHLPSWTEDVVETSQVGEARRGRGTILLVDDDAEIRRVLGRILEDAGHQVTALGSPGEAAALLAGGYHFDLLITDGVPQRDNTPPLMNQFFQFSPVGKVLIYSGYPAEQLTERGIRQSDRVAVAQKPLPAQTLLQRVSALVADDTPPF